MLPPASSEPSPPRIKAFGEGGSLVEFENALACASVEVDFARPSANRPSEGFFVIKISAEAREFKSSLVDRTLRATLRQVVDTQGLCVASGEIVLRVRLKIHVLHATSESSTLNCASLACWKALTDFRFESVTVDGVLKPSKSSTPQKLPLSHVPIVVTVEGLAVAVNVLGEICCVDGRDCSPTNYGALLKKAVLVAKTRFKHLS